MYKRQGLSNATSSTGGLVAIDPDGAVSTTIINDTQGAGGTTEGPGLWSVSGPANSDEGSAAQFTVSLTGIYGQGEVLTVDIGLTDIGTNSSDYADLVVAIEAAVAGNPDVSFNPATGTFEYTSPADGSSMTDIVIDFALNDDGLLEGSEDFTLSLSNAASATGASVELNETSASLTTTIIDSSGATPGQWSVSGPAETVEGSTPQFVISLSGEYGAGEIVTVDLAFTDIDTNSDDHSDFIAAIQAAVADNPDVTFDAELGTLVFISPGDGASMADIVIDIALTDDGLIEAPEAFSFALTNPGSPTGASVEISSELGLLSSLVSDAGPAGSEWSITGPNETAEDETPQYAIALSGVFGAGESVSVELSVGHISTDGDDFADTLASLQAAVDANPDLTFTLGNNAVNSASSQLLQSDDPLSTDERTGNLADSASNILTGTLTYTSPVDGASMQPLEFGVPVLNDSLIEDQESFFVALNKVASPDLDIGVNSESAQIETLIQDNDFHAASEPEIGSALDGPAREVVVSDPVQQRGILEIANISLRRATATLSEGIILETVNRISSLGSMFGSSGLGSPWIDALQREGNQLEQSVLNGSSGEEDSRGDSSGVGYRGTHSVDPTDECGRFFIDTIVRGGQLSIIARSTIDPQLTPGVTGYSAMITNGQLIELSEGEYMVDLSVQTENIELQITAHRENGDDLTRFVEIDMATGEITETGAQIDVVPEWPDQ